ncbi:hypothetical protein GLOIN_2v1788287 [Rhizophagus clarus]|uniref:Uncharacterized protein n=1 Tax=Rhizophagus clarus TaxID=94130 RepID=A0A8H3M688_9GLOM|nr:hypothetical protein GLOIN_2v1788287 [Rhizophagus clarus]
MCSYRTLINFHRLAKIRDNYTTKNSAQYCDEGDEVKKFGKLIISLPDVQLGKERRVLFGLIFGRMEIIAIAKNQFNGQNYRIILKLDI